ncbi:DNA repair protein [Amylocystis lapponica]|nr:DNA repair protein [Amylocystis lapponica]
MHAPISAKKQQARIASLQAEIDEMQQILGPDVDADKIVSRHIKLLHQYNEAKDATQILIGRLAAHRQTTIRQVHLDYDLSSED